MGSMSSSPCPFASSASTPAPSGPSCESFLQAPEEEVGDRIMITILGAGGTIGNELVTLLASRNQPFRLVGRNPRATPGATETLAADLTDKDQTLRAVAGSSVVYLVVG